MKGMERLLKTGKARVLNKTLELTGINKKGIEFPISLTISHKAQQGYSMFIAFLRDITLEKKNQEQLIVKTKQLEEMNKILERKNLELENSNAELISFSFVASHDLQEPLRKIQTFGKRILETESFSGQTKEYFNRMISTGERMQNLIVSLLDYSQINMAELDFQLCNLNTIVEQSINDLSLRIHEKEAIIEYENLPSINGVRIQIEQLFTNLVDNAIKYSRTGIKPHIKITSKCIHGNTIPHPSVNNLIQYYELKITDNGIGFDTVYANKIFEPFQRLHGNNEYRGTGIGLTIIKKIVANHNGLIKAEGKLDIGSVFTIYLPVT
jgi:light-regulated signal transduction histidine kinase (bacteriophytochrome)